MAGKSSGPTTDVAWWTGELGSSPLMRFPAAVRSSRYVTARDGVRIAVDVYLPEGLPADERVPAILTQTPYFRSMQYRTPLFEKIVRKLSMVGQAEFAEAICRYGYANVNMDLRGAGASFGKKLSIGMPDAVADGADIMDWIVEQPWSNGNIGAVGISAVGMTAEWLTTAKHPALKAICPRFTVFDIFAAVHPGGITASRFTRDIGELVRAMDSNRLYKMPENKLAQLLMRAMVKGITPADEDDDGHLLAQAVAEHRDNEAFDKDLLAITYRDDQLPFSSLEGTVETLSPFTHADDMRASDAAVYCFGGWHDGSFPREMISLYKTVSNPGSRIVIGPWPHGGRWYSSPLIGRRRPTDFDHVAEIVRFFDLHLRDLDHGVSSEAPIHYFTMAEERWKSAYEWPLPTTVPTAYHLGPSGALSATGPASNAASDVYAVDFTAGTGVHSRFGKHLGGGRYPVRYPDRAQRDQHLLTYTSTPLAHDMEVSGHPMVTLFLSSTATDGAFLVYLEDVGPDNEVLVVTDGYLRGRARTIADGPPPYWMPGPYRPFRRADDQALTPGEVVELEFDLYPVSWLFRVGHAVRLAVAGADKDNLQAVAFAESPTITVHHGIERPSRLLLPVIPAESS